MYSSEGGGAATPPRDPEVEAALERVVSRTGHARLRDLYRARPADYKAAVLAWDASLGPAPEARFAAEASARALAARAAGKPVVGLYGQALQMGGAESHGALLVRSTADALGWAGVASWSPPHPLRAAEFAESVPVGSGPAEARHLAGLCDVLVTWAVPRLDALLAGLPRRPKVVGVVHSPAESDFARDLYARSVEVDQ